MLIINERLKIPESEVELSAIRARGAGGQNVNKVSSAVHLRFNIAASSLPVRVKQRMLVLGDSRINKAGEVVIKSQEYRNREKNRKAALDRLSELIATAARTRKKRKPTTPGKVARTKRMDNKSRRGRLKRLRDKNLIRID